MTDQSKATLVDSMDEAHLRDEVRRLSHALTNIDRKASYRAEVHLGQMIGGSDICATCSAHCNVMDENEAEIKALRGIIAEALDIANICAERAKHMSADPKGAAIYELVADTLHRRIGKPVMDDYRRAKTVVEAYERG